MCFPCSFHLISIGRCASAGGQRFMASLELARMSSSGVAAQDNSLHGVALEMLNYLVDELQPSLHTAMKEAINEFSEFVFKHRPLFREDDVQLLLFGRPPKNIGLIAAIGQTARFSSDLKKSASLAFSLLVKLLYVARWIAPLCFAAVAALTPKPNNSLALRAFFLLILLLMVARFILPTAGIRSWRTRRRAR